MILKLSHITGTVYFEKIVKNQHKIIKFDPIIADDKHCTVVSMVTGMWFKKIPIDIINIQLFWSKYEGTRCNDRAWCWLSELPLRIHVLFTLEAKHQHSFQVQPGIRCVAQESLYIDFYFWRIWLWVWEFAKHKQPVTLLINASGRISSCSGNIIPVSKYILHV